MNFLSMMKNQPDGRELTSRIFDRECMVRLYYDWLCYKYWSPLNHSTNVYGMQFMSVTKHVFWKWKKKVSETGMGKKRMEHAIWIVKKHFVLKQFLNDPVNVHGDGLAYSSHVQRDLLEQGGVIPILQFG